MSALGGIWIVSIFLFVVGIIKLFQVTWLRKEGIDVTGTLLHISLTPKKYINYNFNVGGEEYQMENKLNFSSMIYEKEFKAFAETAKAGDRITIKYQPSNPKINLPSFSIDREIIAYRNCAFFAVFLPILLTVVGN